MDDNNSFLNNYKKKTGSPDEPVERAERETPVKQEGPPALRYEQKSKFVRPARRDNGSQPPGGRKAGPLVPILVGAVVLIGAIIAALLLLNRGVEVKDLSGWTKNDAMLWASQNGIQLQVDEQYNDQVDENKVVSQSPAGGQKVKKGEFVRIVVSKGHDLTVTLALPDIMSLTKEEIEAWAAENFMTKVRITAEFSAEVPAGRVISFEINDNTVVDEVRRNTPIYIIVSKGAVDETATLITVPNFREKSVSESYLFANENGLVLTIEEQYDDYAPKGTIMAQSIKPDEKVKKGDEIVLIVSKGKKVLVPDFSEYSKQKATSMAAELGITASVVEKYSSLATGEFISQSIPADSEYVDGDVLELYYSLGNKIVISSFVGQTRDAIEAWAKELNDQGASITISVGYTQSSSEKGKIIYQDKANTVIGVKTTIRITVSKGKAVFVPDFVAPEGAGYDEAITREKAMAMCEALNLIPIFVASTQSGRLPGEIWYQSVAAGKEVAEGTTITLKYNPANATISVPDFTGMTQDEIIAAGWHRKFNLTFAIGDEYVDGYAGRVYQQSITAGTTVATGSAITLYIGAELATEEPSPTP